MSVLTFVAIGFVLLLTACVRRAEDSSPPRPAHSPARTLPPGEVVPWADIPAPLGTRAQPEVPPLEATLAAPSTVRAGEILRYELTLRNNMAATYRWPAECPVFLAILQTPPPERRNVAGNHQQLNCRLARALPPGGESRFELQFGVPREVPAGLWSVALSFTQPGRLASPPATATLAIER